VVFNRFGQGYVVRRENQFHKKRMQPLWVKIQFSFAEKLGSEIHAKTA